MLLNLWANNFNALCAAPATCSIHFYDTRNPLLSFETWSQADGNIKPKIACHGWTWKVLYTMSRWWLLSFCITSNNTRDLLIYVSLRRRQTVFEESLFLQFFLYEYPYIDCMYLIFWGRERSRKMSCGDIVERNVGYNTKVYLFYGCLLIFGWKWMVTFF